MALMIMFLRSYFASPWLSSNTKRRSFWSCRIPQPSSNIFDTSQAQSSIQGIVTAVLSSCLFSCTTVSLGWLILVVWLVYEDKHWWIGSRFYFSVSFFSRKLMSIAFVDMNPFPLRQIQNRRSFHLEKVRLELTELEAIRQTFLRERETSQDGRSFVSDDEEDNWPWTSKHLPRLYGCHLKTKRSPPHRSWCAAVIKGIFFPPQE